MAASAGHRLLFLPQIHDCAAAPAKLKPPVSKTTKTDSRTFILMAFASAGMLEAAVTRSPATG